MTDTAGLFKDLEWDRGFKPAEVHDGEYLGSSAGYAIYQDPETGEYQAICGSFPNLEAAKHACQTDYENFILSTLNLDAFKARIRAEALEEIKALAERKFGKASDDLRIDLITYDAFIGFIRALKEGE